MKYDGQYVGERPYVYNHKLEVILSALCSSAHITNNVAEGKIYKVTRFELLSVCSSQHCCLPAGNVLVHMCLGPFPVPAWGLSGYTSFLPQTKDIVNRVNRDLNRFEMFPFVSP